MAEAIKSAPALPKLLYPSFKTLNCGLDSMAECINRASAWLRFRWEKLICGAAPKGEKGDENWGRGNRLRTGHVSYAIDQLTMMSVPLPMMCDSDEKSVEPPR